MDNSTQEHFSKDQYQHAFEISKKRGFNIIHNADGSFFVPYKTLRSKKKKKIKL